MDTDRYDLRLVPAALTAWAVTAGGIVYGVAGAVVAALAGVAVAATVSWWASGRIGAGQRVGAGVLAVAVLGCASAVAVGLRVHELGRHPITDRYGATATVTVKPTESPRVVGGGRLMFRASLLTVDADDVSGRVIVFASARDYSDLTAGRPARFQARISAPSRRDLTVAMVSAIGRPALGEAAPVQSAAQHVRTSFADAAGAVLPADEAAMLPALVLGDTSAVTGRVAEEFRASGLTHLTAVSGANVTIVCGAVLFSAGLIGPRAAVVLAAMALVGFVVLVQPSASVLRAAAMGAITLLAVVSRRRRQALPALAGSVIVLIVAAPELAVDVGFALSVSATAALIVVAPMWSRRLVAGGCPKPLADAVSVAVAAQLVTAPLIAGISGRFSVVSVAANLAVAAVIPPITVVGTAAAALCTPWPTGSQLLIRFTGPELWWLLRVARWAAAVPGSSVPVPSGLVGVVSVATLGVGLLVTWRWRWIRIGVGVAAVCLLAWTVAGHCVGAVGPA